MSTYRLPSVLAVGISLAFLIGFYCPAWAEEVEKGKIPAEHLAQSCKVLPWGSPVWDAPEAMSCMNNKEKVIWIDTRPDSFYKQGSVRNAVVLMFDKSSANDNGLTLEKLEAAIKSAGLTKDNAKIAFFCQGPECHRSYNAAYVAVKQWGFKPENVIWFRAGYPLLVKEIQADAKLKRKASTYLTDEAVGNL
jgi:rhodanese-related sulfurtransferase